MDFTQDWFSHNVENFEICMAALTTKKRFLEIGSFEGRSTCWLLENGLDKKGSITCIDPYITSEYDTEIDMTEVEKRFWNNVREVVGPTQKISAYKEPSYQALAEMICSKYESEFDFIYVDGSHKAYIALTDACMAWGLLKKGGVMLFDDYLYTPEPTRVGIDAFLRSFSGQYETIVDSYQYGIKRL